MKAAVNTVLLAACASLVPASASAQTPTIITELDLTTGFATEDRVSAFAAQIRGLGEISGIRFNVEGVWAGRSEDGSDAFGAAYHYGEEMRLSEGYAERMFQRSWGMIGLRAGQYRSPFGIFNRSDHAYSGFLRAPLIRYDGYWAITNSFRERGVDVIVGSPRLSVEASVGAPGDIGVANRKEGVNSVVRAQAYLHPLIIGVSHMTSETYGPSDYAHGRLKFTGVDARWSHSAGVQLRGEWIVGQPWDGPETNGGYVDAIFHRPFMGPVTAVLRSEWLEYTSKYPFDWYGQSFKHWTSARFTTGGKVRLPAGFTAQVNVVRQSEVLSAYGRNTLDVALTYSVRAPR
jgi:hypothetical protein